MANRASLRKVRDCYQLSSPRADLLEEKASLDEVIKALARDRSSRAVFIVDEGGGLCGIVTARSLMSALARGGSADFELPRANEILASCAADFMVPPESVRLDDTIEAAIQKAVRAGLEDLPVVEGGRIVGVLDCFEMLLNLELGE